MITWGKIIDAISRVWCDYRDRNDRRQEQEELAPEAEIDPRVEFRLSMWRGKKHNTKGQDQ